jgi:hypothetical protein
MRAHENAKMKAHKNRRMRKSDQKEIIQSAG